MEEQRWKVIDSNGNDHTGGGRGSYRRPGVTKPPKPITGKLIDPIVVTEGLDATVNHFNSILVNDYNVLVNKVQELGPAVLKDIGFQNAYNLYKIKASELTREAKRELTALEKAKDSFRHPETDKNAYAVSVDNTVMAFNKSNKQYEEEDVTKVINDLENYNVLTKDQVAEWKNLTYIPDSSAGGGRGVNRGISVIDRFIGNGAVGANTFKSLFIDPNKDKIKYTIIDEKLHYAGDRFNDGNIPVEQVVQNIKEYIRNDFAPGSSPMNPGKFDISKVIEDVYGDVVGASASKSVIRASLISEVMQDRQSMFLLSKMDTGKKREELFEKLIRLKLLGKVFDSTLKIDLSSEGDVITGGPGTTVTGRTSVKTDPNTDPIQAAAINIINKGGDGAYVIEDSGKVVKPDGGPSFVSVNRLNIVSKVDAIPSTMLNLPIKAGADNEQEKNIVGNKVISINGNTSKLYTMQGVDLNDAIGNNRQAKDFLKYHILQETNHYYL